MSNMVWLLFSHFIGDWALQSQFVAMGKGREWIIMLSHCMIWTACVSIGLQFLGIYALWKVLFLLVGHWVVDLWKTKKKTWSPYIYIDQGWHIFQLLVVYLL